MSILQQDKERYLGMGIPLFQIFFRKATQTNFKPLRLLYKCLFVYLRNKRLIELAADTQIGGGLYFGHAYCITINPKAVIGRNCNIHRGVVIGQENRGVDKAFQRLGIVYG